MLLMLGHLCFIAVTQNTTPSSSMDEFDGDIQDDVLLEAVGEKPSAGMYQLIIFKCQYMVSSN